MNVCRSAASSDTFCISCLRPWVQSRGRAAPCPLCKRPLNLDALDLRVNTVVAYAMEAASAWDHAQLERPLFVATPMTLQELLAATAAALWGAVCQRVRAAAVFLTGLFLVALRPIVSVTMRARGAAGKALWGAAAATVAVCARASGRLTLFATALAAWAARYARFVAAPVRYAVGACAGRCVVRFSSSDALPLNNAGPAAGAPDLRRRHLLRPPGALVRPKPQPARSRNLTIVSAVAGLVAVCATTALLHWRDVPDSKLNSSGKHQPLSRRSRDASSDKRLEDVAFTRDYGRDDPVAFLRMLKRLADTGSARGAFQFAKVLADLCVVVADAFGVGEKMLNFDGSVSDEGIVAWTDFDSNDAFDVLCDALHYPRPSASAVIWEVSMSDVAIDALARYFFQAAVSSDAKGSRVLADRAAFNLGVMYYYSVLMSVPDSHLALKWFRRAANSSDPFVSARAKPLVRLVSDRLAGILQRSNLNFHKR